MQFRPLAPARARETLEKYIRRLEELESLACGFPGVEQAYAVQAGREIRVVVDAKQINDREAAKMCRDLAKAIEETLTYPGEIKVQVLREFRTVEFAKSRFKRPDARHLQRATVLVGESSSRKATPWRSAFTREGRVEPPLR